MWAGINAATARRLGVPGTLPKPRKPRAKKQAQVVPTPQAETTPVVKMPAAEQSLRELLDEYTVPVAEWSVPVEAAPAAQTEPAPHFDTVKDYGLEGSLRAMNCCHCKQAAGDKRTLHQGCKNFGKLLEEATTQDKVLACEKYMAKPGPRGVCGQLLVGEEVTAAKCRTWQKAARKLTLNRLPALGVVAWADLSM